MPGGALTVVAGRPTPIQLGLDPASLDATSVSWQVVSDPPSVQASPSAGTLTVPAVTLDPPTGDPSACHPAAPATQSLAVSASTPGTYAMRFDLRTTEGTALPPVVLHVTVQP
jgi:hypothetical protein